MKTSSPEFRHMQCERIMKTKPWLKTKGPATPEGKAKSKMNALKVSPEIHALLKEYKQLLHQQKEVYIIQLVIFDKIEIINHIIFIVVLVRYSNNFK